MALLKIKKVVTKLGFVFASIIGIFSFLFLVALIMAAGVPLHDFNLWQLDMYYKTASFIHPSDSTLLMKKTYLGGPDEHGSQSCSYVVAEVRSSPRSKKEILRAYNGFTIQSVIPFDRIPLKILFIDEESWPPELPYDNWWGELNEKFKSSKYTVYLVYAAMEKYPFLGDIRCDD